ncbi:hypothetical protein RV15_GL001367 [Enterococcus silesiacus]|uniref:CAT RNA-binding domain-containing protein n=1 Tax=Enterococcus silesiacus TaxID=332949 RepID=A0AA91GDQ6_9ENTE|nr:CAT RNA binding domain-containing protein [Enterococcus silesiacus]OJG93335.1 hypothetical protein RV15_GL001367 [Enterococcus silesiacus]
MDNPENEIIGLGKGIAYQKKIGETIADSLVNKKFVLQSQELSGKF